MTLIFEIAAGIILAMIVLRFLQPILIMITILTALAALFFWWAAYPDTFWAALGIVGLIVCVYWAGEWDDKLKEQRELREFLEQAKKDKE